MYNQPTELFLHPDGDSLVVADVGNYAVRRVLLADGSATTIGGTPGSPGSQSGGVGVGRLGAIGDMVLGHDRSVAYIADNSFFSIRVLNLSTGVVSTICGGNGLQISNGECMSAGLGIIRGIDVQAGGRFLWMLTYSQDPTSLVYGVYLQYIDMNFMYTGALDSLIEGGGDFWLRFLGGFGAPKLATWGQDPLGAGSSTGGRVVELIYDQGQGMNQDLLQRGSLMDYAAFDGGNTSTPQVGLQSPPPALWHPSNSSFLCTDLDAPHPVSRPAVLYHHVHVSLRLAIQRTARGLEEPPALQRVLDRARGVCDAVVLWLLCHQAMQVSLSKK